MCMSFVSVNSLYHIHGHFFQQSLTKFRTWHPYIPSMLLKVFADVLQCGANMGFPTANIPSTDGLKAASNI